MSGEPIVNNQLDHQYPQANSLNQHTLSSSYIRFNSSHSLTTLSCSLRPITKKRKTQSSNPKHNNNNNEVLHRLRHPLRRRHPGMRTLLGLHLHQRRRQPRQRLNAEGLPRAERAAQGAHRNGRAAGVPLHRRRALGLPGPRGQRARQLQLPRGLHGRGGDGGGL